MMPTPLYAPMLLNCDDDGGGGGYEDDESVPHNDDSW